MPKSDLLRGLIDLFRKVFVVDILLFLAVGLFCLLAGWRTVYQYGDALVKAGAVGLIIMLVTNLGGTLGRADDIEAFSITRSMRSDEFLLRSARDAETRQHILLASILALGIVIITGAALLTMP